MALEKYKVLQSGVEGGISYLPEKAVPLGVWADATGKTVVAFIMKYSDWVEEFPEEALKEAQVEALKHNAEAAGDGKGEGAADG